jgi:hypothetical protein
MTPELAERVEKIRLEFGDMCFACGRRNDVGLHIDDFTWDGTTVTGSFDPRDEYRGAGDVLHGGVAATALDEISVWAGILGEGVLSVTGRFGTPLPQSADRSRSGDSQRVGRRTARKATGHFGQTDDGRQGGR